MNTMKKTFYLLVAVLISATGLLFAQEMVSPGVPPVGCNDCQYKEKQVACFRAGYLQGQPYVYIGGRTKCVDGTDSCTSSDCKP